MRKRTKEEIRERKDGGKGEEREAKEGKERVRVEGKGRGEEKLKKEIRRKKVKADKGCGSGNEVKKEEGGGWEGRRKEEGRKRKSYR